MLPRNHTVPSEPQVHLLSYKHRVRFFWLLVAVFLFALPVLIFYTTGYRVVFTDEEAEIVTTGGIYVATEDTDLEIVVDGVTRDGRQFLGSSLYIQNIDVGQREIVVRGAGVTTWVKELPVFAHKVTEVAAFNLPKTPVVRPITPSTTPAGTPVVTSTSSGILAVATTSVPVTRATTSGDTSYVSNEEFPFVRSLFGTTTVATNSVFARFRDEVERFVFRSELATTTSTSSRYATTTIKQDELVLTENGEEVLVRYDGESTATIPHYFCVEYRNASQTAAWYGEHVLADIRDEYGANTRELSGRVCREDIQIDRKRQDVFDFAFFPGRTDLVLMHLEDGVYVVEVDDRAWQNVQQLYPGRDVRMAVTGGQIFIKDGAQYLEVLPELDE